MRLSPDLLSALPIVASLSSAADRPGDFFPSRVAFAAGAASEAVPARIQTQLKRGWEPARAEIVQVPKWGGGTRPAIDLPLGDRVVLDALISHLRDRVVPGLVNWSPISRASRVEAHSRLADSAASHVLAADVTAFYEFVEHETLADELLDLTGDDEAVEALQFVLGQMMPSSRGLPQGPSSVGALADVYLSMVDRRLARDGFLVVRFTDDFRVGAGSWWHAQRVQIRLERYLRDLGLVINVGKTTTPSIDVYATWESDARPPWLDGLRRLQDEMADAEARDELAEIVEIAQYFGPPIILPGVIYDPIADQIVSDLEDQLGAPHFWGTQENVRQSKRIQLALTALGPRLSTTGLPHLEVLFRSFPHLAMETTLYLRSLVASTVVRVEAFEAIQRLIDGDAFLFDWQIGWLLHALVPAGEDLPRDLQNFAREQFDREDAPWFVRGRAAVVLAASGSLAYDNQLKARLSDAPHATTPDLHAAAAATQLRDHNTVALPTPDPLLRAVTELVTNQGITVW